MKVPQELVVLIFVGGLIVFFNRDFFRQKEKG